MTDRQQAALNALMRAAAAVRAEGAAFARLDDPHRYDTLHREFDNGKAAVSLCIEYLAGGRVRVHQRLTGTHQGEPKTVELFSFALQGPADDRAH